jgi:hypothetical protein
MVCECVSKKAKMGRKKKIEEMCFEELAWSLLKAGGFTWLESFMKAQYEGNF